ncbi:MAG: DUF2071 domain-containing protein [Taibaiella sp.]|nr:DUF2071 domain-containing protein [Taibaiella sp.]
MHIAGKTSEYCTVWQPYPGISHSTLLRASKEHFITEHYWGYIKINERISYEYEIRHPQWQCYPVVAADVAVDFGQFYGADFAVLNGAEPDSVMSANGSEITTVWYRVL